MDLGRLYYLFDRSGQKNTLFDNILNDLLGQNLWVEVFDYVTKKCCTIEIDIHL